MASPALAALAAFASRRSRFCFRARAFLPDIALDAWVVPCASRVRDVVRRVCVASSSGLPRKALVCQSVRGRKGFFFFTLVGFADRLAPTVRRN